MKTKTEQHTPTPQQQLQDLESEYGAAFIVRAVNAHEELVKATKLSLTILNSIANELKSDFNLAHDNMAANACYIAAQCEKALAKAVAK